MVSSPGKPKKYRPENLVEQVPNPYTIITNPAVFGHKKTPTLSHGGIVKVGGDLLSRSHSTIGACGLNFSVRDGKRWNPAAIATLRLSIS